ncbi:hypothetical protein NUU61_004200 [Penicillium alfredii]|uniref:DUF4291 domain-containing protein n=1 Tax=Penicillium alfredii TaxID=1506179 RepID=A0A9W9FKP3_9EURO|nr:uncharacterized protein NUU61_004200 [Penicillium alfredii]KAJ5101978.1 hypothetical protein NUU61_004200 [Penicillium alfredii]
MDPPTSIPERAPHNRHRAIRAMYTTNTITVYQAYSPEIAEPALQAQTFVALFNRNRMTWIKPSFLWMAYRSGWASKPQQERVLAIEITIKGFEWALRHACLSHDDNNKNNSQDKQGWQQRLRSSPVRVQWDPGRDLLMRPLGTRAIQIGLSGEATMKTAAKYVEEGDLIAAEECLPEERVYELSPELREILQAM